MYKMVALKKILVAKIRDCFDLWHAEKYTYEEILKKVTSKKSGMAKEEIMPMLVNALKRINPHKHKVKGIMYLSLKT